MNVGFGHGADYIGPGNWSYSWSEIWLNGGNDQVEMPSNAQYAPIHAGEGHDRIWGSSNNDLIFGDGGNDTLSGRNGADTLYGGLGNDTISGGDGRDVIKGNHGVDTLYGGAGTDYFTFDPYDSHFSAGFTDTLKDWDVRADYILTSVRGTSSNYLEYQTTATNTNAVHNEIFGLRTVKDHVFAYNPSTDTGYLLSDLDGDNYFDSGVIIEGAGSAADMNYSDLV